MAVDFVCAGWWHCSPIIHIKAKYDFLIGFGISGFIICHLERRASCRDRVIAVELILSLKTSLLLNLKHSFLCPNTTVFRHLERPRLQRSCQTAMAGCSQLRKVTQLYKWLAMSDVWGVWGKATRCSAQLLHLLLIEQQRRKTETQQLAILLAFTLSLIYSMGSNVQSFSQASTAQLLVQLMSREHLREHSPRFQIMDIDLRISHTRSIFLVP